jgi:hypothetical protein
MSAETTDTSPDSEALPTFADNSKGSSTGAEFKAPPGVSLAASGAAIEAEGAAPHDVEPFEGSIGERGGAGGGVVGVDRSVVEPDRYVVHAEDTEHLQAEVDEVGRDHQDTWLADVNPRRDIDPAYRTNCGDCARAYATTAQTDRAVAATGDGLHGEEAETMWEWAGVEPDNTVCRDLRERPEDFDQRAWDTVHRQLEGEPSGTVAVVGVDRTPEVIDGIEVPRPGHWLNAEVREDGVHWVDAQSGHSGHWPPSHLSNLASAESVYRRPGEAGWRAGSEAVSLGELLGVGGTPQPTPVVEVAQVFPT